MNAVAAPLRRLLPVIITVVAGCDNVQWGGAEIAVVPPPPRETDQEAGPQSPTEERLPEGPVLYYVRPAAEGAVMLPVAEISGDTLRPVRAVADWEIYGRRFIAEHLRQGAEFALFRNAGRVGTFVAQSAAVPDAATCPRVPRATGVLELTPGADQATEFLALAKPHAPDSRQPAAVPAEPDRRMQILAPILAERLLRARNAPLPGNWNRAMSQLVPFPVAGARDPAFAATFLVGDTLGLGLDDDGYSLFFIARPEPQVGYSPVFAGYVDYAVAGKAAPRVVDFLDWDRDGETELLLEVFGTADAWFEAVGRVGSDWRRIHRDRCPRPVAPVAPAETSRSSPAPP